MRDNILLWLDRAILILAGLVDMIPGKVDDFALSFLKWARNDSTFLDWIEKDPPEDPAPNALTVPPTPLVEAFRRWQTETGAQPAMTGGNWMELIGYVMQIITWLQKRRGTPVPA